jgi:hypothetical protein
MSPQAGRSQSSKSSNSDGIFLFDIVFLVGVHSEKLMPLVLLFGTDIGGMCEEK